MKNSAATAVNAIPASTARFHFIDVSLAFAIPIAMWSRGNAEKPNAGSSKVHATRRRAARGLYVVGITRSEGAGAGEDAWSGGRVVRNARAPTGLQWGGLLTSWPAPCSTRRGTGGSLRAS